MKNKFRIRYVDFVLILILTFVTGSNFTYLRHLFIESKLKQKTDVDINQGLLGNILSKYSFDTIEKRDLSHIKTMQKIINIIESKKWNITPRTSRRLGFAYYSLALYYFDWNRYNKSIELLEKCIKRKRDPDEHTWNLLGCCYYRKKKMNKAKQCFEVAINIRNDFAIAKTNLNSIKTYKKYKGGKLK